MAKIGLSAPWVIFYREIEAMFRYDSEVKVLFDEENKFITLHVDNGEKADALSRLLPSEKVFGDVTLTIKILPANGPLKVNDICPENVFYKAFDGNKALVYIRTVSGVFSNTLIYVVFKKEVIQYWTDDLGDINGVASTLYQNIARDIFENSGFENVYYCTDTEDPPICDMLSSPLGEWP